MAGILKYWREAATLILVARNSQKLSILSSFGNKSSETASTFTYDVLMLKRSSKSTFMPSSYVFPGGIADDSDFSKDWLDVFCLKDINKTFEFFRRGGVGPPMFSRKRAEEFEGIPSELAFRICAIRETFEECGVLLVRKSSDIENVSLAKPLSAFGTTLSQSVIQPWRERVDRDAREFVKMCRELEVVPDVWSLYEWSNWLTPLRLSMEAKSESRRYDTAFFMCEVDEIPEIAQDNRETVHAVWSSPDSLINKYLRDDANLPVPQIFEIGRLLNFKDAESLQNFTWNRSKRRVERCFPVINFCSDGILFLHPGDELYPKNPDVEGINPLIYLQDTVDEVNKRCTRMNRITKKKGNNDSSASERKLFCNVKMSDGQIKPYFDSLSLPIPS